MTSGSGSTHLPPTHRRRPRLIRLGAVAVLVGVVVAGVVVGLLAWMSGAPSGEGMSADSEVSAPGPDDGEAGDPDAGVASTLTEPSPADPVVGVDDAIGSGIDSSFRVTEVTPSEGSMIGGEAVVVTGTGFREGVQVRVAGRAAPQVTVLNDRKLRVLLPPGLPGVASIEVGSAIDVPVVVDGLFTYVDRPPRVVMAIRPTLGTLTGGTAITIVGTGFEPGARVVLGGERAVDVEVLDSTRITATTPPHEEGIVDVVVRNPGMPTAELPGAFQYVPGPTLTGFDPVDLPEGGGVPVTVWGTGFAPGIEVTLNGLPATDVQVIDDTMLTAIAPPGIPGPATLVVRNAGEPPATLLDAAFYSAPPPVEEAAPIEAEGDAAADPAVPTTEDPAEPPPVEPDPVDPGSPPEAPADAEPAPAAG